ncbi:ATP-binding protein [Microbacterium sp. NPDC089189]|uniref:AlbA family DNA-binding domain-containing protein n=1 Tax=Microbacterium sp. NPDC089189 TaxID=3154972 RepID=UPI003446B2E2
MFPDAASPMLVDFALALPVVLLLSYGIARLLRRVFGARLSLGTATMTLVAVLGVSIGILFAGLFLAGQRLWMPTTLLLGIGVSIGLSFATAGIVAGVRRRVGTVDVAAVLASGESERTEFKETARWNVREAKKDPRMELAVAKTVAAFLNSRGGVLVIGADDEGHGVGLERDLATLRTPDHDRFELWLRDMLSTSLGRNAAALPRIRFGAAPGGATVCVVQCRPAAKPVFLTAPKDGGSTTDLWVRVGNSTRALGVDEAVEYVARHWRPTVGSFLLGRPTG